MIKPLTPDQVKYAKAWLHDIFVYGGLLSYPRRPLEMSQYGCMYGDQHWRRDKFRPDAKKLCEAIKFRLTSIKEFLEYDEALKHISELVFNPDLASVNPKQVVKKDPEMLAKYIAWYCLESNPNKKYYWDDSNTSAYEREEIKKTTLGKVLWDLRCFTSQPDVDPAPSANNATSTTTNNNAAGSAPKNDFKSRGPLSGLAVDMLSTPGQKEKLSGTIYCILGHDASGKELEDCAYIRPVEADPKMQQKYIIASNHGNTNKVLFGKSKGYGFCTCFFTDLTDANDFLSKLDTKLMKLDPKVASIGVHKKTAQSNGYFRIGTQFGPVYISAAKLNEDIQTNEEPLIEETSKQVEECKLTNKEKWDRYEEAFYHEM